jgi:dCMP deaminase
VNRITREQMFMEMAHVVAKRSTCMRLSVGCILVTDKNILSIGYNGPPAGEEHCTGRHCSPPGSGCVRAVHAEINAFEKIRLRTLFDPLAPPPMDVYVTDSPCPLCFDLMTQPQWNVANIYFTTLYRLNSHLEHPAINIYQITPSGYVINYQSGELVNG